MADVKEHRLNAKREHLRARIGVVLGFQARLGGICETIGNIIRKLFENARFMQTLEKLRLIPIKYHLRKLEIRSYVVNVPHNLNVLNFSSFLSGKRRELIRTSDSESSNASQASLSSSASSAKAIGIFEQVKTETGYYYHQDITRDDSLFNEEENTRLLRKTDDIRDAVEESVIRTNNEIRKAALSLQNELEDIKRRLMQ